MRDKRLPFKNIMGHTPDWRKKKIDLSNMKNMSTFI